eukprot:15439640-Alexandrium_andersonii.AAC.1
MRVSRSSWVPMRGVSMSLSMRPSCLSCRRGMIQTILAIVQAQRQQRRHRWCRRRPRRQQR